MHIIIDACYNFPTFKIWESAAISTIARHVTIAYNKQAKQIAPERAGFVLVVHACNICILTYTAGRGRQYAKLIMTGRYSAKYADKGGSNKLYQ